MLLGWGGGREGDDSYGTLWTVLLEWLSSSREILYWRLWIHCDGLIIISMKKTLQRTIKSSFLYTLHILKKATSLQRTKEWVPSMSIIRRSHCWSDMIHIFIPAIIIMFKMGVICQIRSLQSESEDQKTEIDLMKRRIEQLRKRRDYGVDSWHNNI